MICIIIWTKLLSLSLALSLALFQSSADALPIPFSLLSLLRLALVKETAEASRAQHNGTQRLLNANKQTSIWSITSPGSLRRAEGDRRWTALDRLELLGLRTRGVRKG